MYAYCCPFPGKKNRGNIYGLPGNGKMSASSEEREEKNRLLKKRAGLCLRQGAFLLIFSMLLGKFIVVAEINFCRWTANSQFKNQMTTACTFTTSVSCRADKGEFFPELSNTHEYSIPKKDFGAKWTFRLLIYWCTSTKHDWGEQIWVYRRNN